MGNLVKRLRDWEHVHPEDQDKPEGHLYEEAADRIEELESKLRKSALQELSALGQAEDAYQAQLAVEAKLAKALEKLEYWFDADQEVLDAMTPDERADHMRQLQMIREALTSGQSY